MKEREQINQHIVQLNDTVRDWFEEKNPDERKEFHLRRHLWYKHVIKTTEDYLRAVEEYLNAIVQLDIDYWCV